MFEEFWEPTNLQKQPTKGRALAPLPLQVFAGFSATQNRSDSCLSLVFVPFNPFWLAGALKNYILGPWTYSKNEPCKLRHLVALRGQKCKTNGYLPIQGRMHIFEKEKSQKALNHVLTLQNARARRELSIDVLYVTRASICVELRPFYRSKRISVPMSYINVVGINKS